MSAKNLDNKNRLRNKIVAFRMSPEEAEQLDIKVKLSGLTKQEYLIRRSLQQDIVVVGNPKMYKALKSELAKILEELQRIQWDCVSDELLDVIRLISSMLNEFKGENE